MAVTKISQGNTPRPLGIVLIVESSSFKKITFINIMTHMLPNILQNYSDDIPLPDLEKELDDLENQNQSHDHSKQPGRINSKCVFVRGDDLYRVRHLKQIHNNAGEV